MRNKALLFPLALLVPLLSGCGGGDGAATQAAASLPPVEVFNWGGQPISVSPPPEGWRREKAQSGGLRGARFIKSGSIGEEIAIAEHYALDERDRCERFTALLADFDNLDRRAFMSRVHRVRPYASPAINSRERDLVDLANGSLDEAHEAMLRADDFSARSAVTTAFEHVVDIRYSLDEVVDRVMFSPTSYDSFGTVEVGSPADGQVGGEPSVSVEFTLDSVERQALFHGKQAYVLKNNRLFVFTFLGLPENLPIFDAILETASFPPGRCVH